MWNLSSVSGCALCLHRPLGDVEHKFRLRECERTLSDSHVCLQISNPCLLHRSQQVSACPVGMEAASLDIAKAYQNSPIIAQHKQYLAVMWRQAIYVQHVAIEGLATAGGIQGNVACMCRSTKLAWDKTCREVG